MPTYTAKCPTCKNVTNYFRRIDYRNDTPNCECGHKTERVLTSCMVPRMPIAESMNIVSPIDGSILRSKSDYDAHNKKHQVLPMSEFEGQTPPAPKDNTAAIAEAASAAYDTMFN